MAAGGSHSTCRQLLQHLVAVGTVGSTCCQLSRHLGGLAAVGSTCRQLLLHLVAVGTVGSTCRQLPRLLPLRRCHTYTQCGLHWKWQSKLLVSFQFLPCCQLSKISTARCRVLLPTILMSPLQGPLQYLLPSELIS